MTTRTATTRATVAKERSPETVAVSRFGESSIIFAHDNALSADTSQLLTGMIQAMGVKRSDVCVTPMGNLENEIAAIKPRVVVMLGKGATPVGSAQVIRTFSLDELLQNPAAKKECWNSLKLAMKELGWKVPAAKSAENK